MLFYWFVYVISTIIAIIYNLYNKLIFLGKFSLHYNEKHIDTKVQENNDIVVLTLKDNAIEFRTYNAWTLKTVIDEKMDKFFAQ